MTVLVLNTIRVVVICAISRLAITKRPPAIIARSLGYGYEIEEDDE